MGDVFHNYRAGISSCNVKFLKKDDKFYAHLLNLETSQDKRNQGCATKLIEAVKNYAKQMGANGVHIYCKPELKEFYNKRGFEQIDVYEDHLEMVYEDI